MQIPLYDSFTGVPAGQCDVPMEVFAAAALVYAFMSTHDVKSLNGLCLTNSFGVKREESI